MKTSIVLSAAAFLFCAMQAPPTAAMTVYIMPDGSGDAPTVQVGLDMCAAGDTVLVAAGTYYENLTWPAVDSIVLMSESGAELTVIDGRSSGRVITIATELDETTNISSFTIQHGHVPGHGGGILCMALASPTIAGNIITNNTITGNDHGGAGIACDNASPTIIDNTITNNTIISGTSTTGGGIGCVNNASPLISNNIISDNNGYVSGGGIGWSGNSAPTITGNLIKNNVAWAAGGGIYVHWDGFGLITDNTFTGNSSGVGGGIYLRLTEITIDNNTINGNTGTIAGGGIHCNGVGIGFNNIILTNNNITGNSSPAGTGAGINFTDGGVATVEQCTISNNYGDGVRCQDGSNPTINYNCIFNNTDYGVQNVDPGIIVDATNNWWGDSSGPGGEGPGLGDEVSLYVAYDPWATDPFEGCQPTGIGSPISPVRFILLQNYPYPPDCRRPPSGWCRSALPVSRTRHSRAGSAARRRGLLGTG